MSGASGVENAQQVVVDDNGYKWVACFPSRTNGTVFGAVYKEDAGAGSYRLLTAQPADGGLLGPIYSIAKDRKGDIWIGTAKGVQVFYNTASALPALPAGTAYAARQPIIESHRCGRRQP